MKLLKVEMHINFDVVMLLVYFKNLYGLCMIFKIWMNYVWIFKNRSFVVIKKSSSLYQKLNKFENLWIHVDSKIYGYPWISQYQRVTRILVLMQVRVSYLSNGAMTSIILSVPVDIPSYKSTTLHLTTNHTMHKNV